MPDLAIKTMGMQRRTADPIPILSRSLVRLCAIAIAGLMGAAFASAQEPARVTESKSATRIRILVHQSLAVPFEEDVSFATSTSPDLVTVEIKNPRQVLLTGLTMGEAMLIVTA